MKWITFICCLAIGVAGSNADLLAQETQTYYLSDGRVIAGEFLRTEEGIVYLKTALGEKSFPESSIWKIEKDGEIVYQNPENRPSAKKKARPQKPNTTFTPYQPPARRQIRTPIFSMGGMFGGIISITEEAIDGYSETEFQIGPALRASAALYLPSGYDSGLGLLTVGFEFGYAHTQMDLEELSDDLGTLELRSLLFLLTIQQFPDRAPGVGLHANLGLAHTFVDFEVGRAIEAIEQEFGVDVSVDAEDSNFLFMGAGGELFVTPNFSLGIDFSLMLGNVEATWEMSSPYATEIIPFDDFLASNAQFTGGLKIWF
ncbi:MAG: hypothetical protein JSW58_09195 [Candidatus Latescibacterota bacterium]|nr:MAG: hypothetical protein JSW58_09195 [Candidatus Latescibacterota bacterium]